MNTRAKTASKKNRLASITVKNFRSFKELTTIDLAPITLIFGRNSVGKSAITDAINFWHELSRSVASRTFTVTDQICGQIKKNLHRSNDPQAKEIYVAVELLLNDPLSNLPETPMSDGLDDGVRRIISEMTGHRIQLALTLPGIDPYNDPLAFALSIDGEKIFELDNTQEWIFSEDAIADALGSEDGAESYLFFDPNNVDAWLVTGRVKLYPGVQKFDRIFSPLAQIYKRMSDDEATHEQLIKRYSELMQQKSLLEKRRHQSLTDEPMEDLRAKIIEHYQVEDERLSLELERCPLSPGSSLVRRDGDALVFYGVNTIDELGLGTKCRLDDFWSETSSTKKQQHYLVLESDLDNPGFRQEVLEEAAENFFYHVETPYDDETSSQLSYSTHRSAARKLVRHTSRVLKALQILGCISHHLTNAPVVSGSRGTLKKSETTNEFMLDFRQLDQHSFGQNFIRDYSKSKIRKLLDPVDSTAIHRYGLHVNQNNLINVDWVESEFRRISKSFVPYEISSNLLELREIGVNTQKGEKSKPSGYRIDLKLTDQGQTTQFDFSDVGESVSCLIPILISLGSNRSSIVKQPELHLHPKTQLELAESLVMSSGHGGRDLYRIWETHSEHIVLRVLRNLRTQRSIEEKPESDLIKGSDIRIYYVARDSSSPESHLIPIRISDKGDFIDEWPHGFFEERLDEYFPT